MTMLMIIMKVMLMMIMVMILMMPMLTIMMPLMILNNLTVSSKAAIAQRFLIILQRFL